MTDVIGHKVMEQPNKLSSRSPYHQLMYSYIWLIIKLPTNKTLNLKNLGGVDEFKEWTCTEVDNITMRGDCINRYKFSVV